MQLAFDSDVEEFRAEFSAFLDEHTPSAAQTLERPRSVSHMPQWARDWQRKLFDNGWLHLLTLDAGRIDARYHPRNGWRREGA